MSAQIKVGDYGTTIELTVYDQDSAIVDLSGSTNRTITLLKPDGTKVTKNASLTTDGTDGKMYITTASGDVDQAGPWQVEGLVVFANGQWHTSTASFHVAESKS